MDTQVQIQDYVAALENYVLSTHSWTRDSLSEKINKIRLIQTTDTAWSDVDQTLTLLGLNENGDRSVLNAIVADLVEVYSHEFGLKPNSQIGPYVNVGLYRWMHERDKGSKLEAKLKDAMDKNAKHDIGDRKSAYDVANEVLASSGFVGLLEQMTRVNKEHNYYPEGHPALEAVHHYMQTNRPTLQRLRYARM